MYIFVTGFLCLRFVKVLLAKEEIRSPKRWGLTTGTNGLRSNTRQPVVGVEGATCTGRRRGIYCDFLPS